MKGDTHKLAGAAVSVIGAYMLNRCLPIGVSPFMQWAVIYPFCIWGSVAPDLDQAWSSCPAKDPVSHIAHSALKLTGAGHRSWHTHSDITFSVLAFSLYLILTKSLTSDTDIIVLMASGLLLGLLSHLVLDAFTVEGINSLALLVFTDLLRMFGLTNGWSAYKIRLVPKTPFFVAGGQWEKIVNQILKVAAYGTIIWVIISVLINTLSIKISYFVSFS